MSFADSKRLRRCRCHQAGITVERDEHGEVVKRLCIITYREIPHGETYLSTRGSTEEILIDNGPDVQRGVPLNE